MVIQPQQLGQEELAHEELVSSDVIKRTAPPDRDPQTLRRLELRTPLLGLYASELERQSAQLRMRKQPLPQWTLPEPCQLAVPTPQGLTGYDAACQHERTIASEEDHFPNPGTPVVANAQQPRLAQEWRAPMCPDHLDPKTRTTERSQTAGQGAFFAQPRTHRLTG